MSNRKRQAVQEAQPEPIDAAPSYPAHWIKGQLLDLRKFTDGTARATVLGEEYDPQTQNAVHFDSLWTAQVFISTWYERTHVR